MKTTLIHRIHSVWAVLCLLATCAMLSPALTGCKSGTFNPVLTGTAVQVAACELVQWKPATQPWLRTAGDVFLLFGSGAPPTPQELEAKLAEIPLGDLQPSERLGIWVAVTQVYAAIYRRDRTVEQEARIREMLSTVGDALKLGSTCGHTTTLARTAAVPVATADVQRVADAIVDALRKGAQ